MNYGTIRLQIHHVTPCKYAVMGLYIVFVLIDNHVDDLCRDFCRLQASYQEQRKAPAVKRMRAEKRKRNPKAQAGNSADGLQSAQREDSRKIVESIQRGEPELPKKALTLHELDFVAGYGKLM